MGIRSGIAGWTGVLIRLAGLAMIVYATILMTMAGGNMNAAVGPWGWSPLSISTVGLAALVFLAPLVKRKVGQFLLVD